MSITILSPHRDDAAFSCGLLLACLMQARVPVCIVNVCTVSDYAPYAANMNDEQRVNDVTRIRAREDEQFMRLLRQQVADSDVRLHMIDLEWKDAPLRRSIPTDGVLHADPVADAELHKLTGALQSLPEATLVVAPLALGGHMDHRLVREAALATWPRQALLFYEDLPYAARIAGELRGAQIEQALPWRCESFYTPVAMNGTKRSMAACYPSQIAADVTDEIERYASALGCVECLYGDADALCVLENCLQSAARAGGNQA